MAETAKTEKVKGRCEMGKGRTIEADAVLGTKEIGRSIRRIGAVLRYKEGRQKGTFLKINAMLLPNATAA